MNCMKNPRFKMREQVKTLNRALELNMSHLGILLYTAKKQFGRIRTDRLIHALNIVEYPDPIEWLKGIGIELQTNDDSAFALIQGLNKKAKPIATEREILDARRDLAALKAYQDEELAQAFNKACQGELIKPGK